MPDQVHMPGLTPRQLQVLRLIADGFTRAEIGRLLGLSEQTVKAYASWAYGRLGARSAAHAVHLAHGYGLIGGGS